MNTKSFLKSKTFWANVLFFLSTLFPAVQSWLVSNPVEFAGLWAAVSVVVRFVTHGKVDLTSSVKGTNLLLLGVIGTALGSGFFLTSCSQPSHYDADLSKPKYGAAIASDASSVLIDAEDVKPVGQSFAPEFRGRVVTDQGEFVVDDDGVSGDVVIDLRKDKSVPVGAGK